MTAIYPIAGCLITAILLLAGRHLALRFGYADRPGGRKQHDAPVPPIGGLAVLPVFLVVSWAAGFSDIVPWPLVCGVVMLLVMGAVDEVRPIRPFFKFALMVWTACFVVIFGEAQIGQLGNLFGFGLVELGFLSKAFTIMCLVLLMNAVNMMDGIDGLAGGFCALVAFWMMVVCAGAGQALPLWTLAILLGALLGFLAFNLRTPVRKSASIFLGDAGALALGLLIGWFAIKLTQGPGAPVAPVTVIWMIAVPVMDAFALFIARSLRGLHPFNADRRHIHHRLLDAGLSHSAATTVLLSLIAIFALVGFMAQANDVPAWVLFYGWMVIFIAHTMVLLSRRGDTILPRIVQLFRPANR